MRPTAAPERLLWMAASSLSLSSRSRSRSRGTHAVAPDPLMDAVGQQEAKEQWGLHRHGRWCLERKSCTYSRYVRTVWSDGKGVYKLVDVALQRDCTGSGKSRREIQSQRLATFATSDPMDGVLWSLVGAVSRR
jgi:hypothetical protein